METVIATFNIQHCRNYLTGKIDYPAFAAELKTLDADIVGLNEVRGAGEAPGYDPQAAILAEALGYRYYFAKAIDVNGPNPYGNAILSRIPLRLAETVAIPDPAERKYRGYYETRCVLHAETADGLTVLISHFGLNPDERENAVGTVLSLYPGKKTVFMGDLNAVPDDPVLLPLFRTLRTVGGDYLTFPSDAPRSRIDHIFLSDDLTLLSLERPDRVVSDHLPLRARIAVPDGEN